MKFVVQTIEEKRTNNSHIVYVSIDKIYIKYRWLFSINTPLLDSTDSCCVSVFDELLLCMLQRLIETAQWGDDSSTIEKQIMNHNKFHSSIQRSLEIDRAREDLVSCRSLLSSPFFLSYLMFPLFCIC